MPLDLTLIDESHVSHVSSIDYKPPITLQTRHGVTATTKQAPNAQKTTNRNYNKQNINSN